MEPSARDVQPPARSPSQAALDLALAEPRRALTLAARAMRAGGNPQATRASRTCDPLATSMALQARGLALRCLERPRESVLALGRAVRVAQQAGLSEQAARAQLSLSLSLSYAGRNRAALVALDRAAEVLRGAEGDRVAVQRGVVFTWLGQPQHAVASISAVLPRLQRSTDRLWEARALSTLGVARVELGQFAAADAALARAEQLFAALGQRADAAGNRHNRGWCAGLRGDVPAALGHYDEAERRFTALGVPAVELQLDRARLLMSVGLMGEAGAVAEDALRTLGERRVSGAHAEALLVGAEIALAQGDPARAREHARRAVRTLGRQQRTGRLLIAQYAQLRARWLAGERTRGLNRAARYAADRLESAGLLATAAEAHLLAGRCALATGDTSLAREQLGRVALSRHRGPALQRSQAWLAEALLRLADRDTRGAAAALRAGLRVIDRYRSALGAVELRYRTATHVTELADLGRRLAVGSRRPEQVLRWSDYSRATALRLPSVRPPKDPVLAAALTALRRLGNSDGDDTPVKQRQRLRLQQEVQRRTRAVPADSAPLLPIQPSVERLARVLGSRALLSYTAVDGILHAVTLVDGRLRLRSLGSVADAERGASFLMAALRRCLSPGRPAQLRDRAWLAFRQAAADVDGELARPLPATREADELVIVSPPWLQLLPWSALPSMAARAITVAPSVAAWFDAASLAPPGGHVTLVAGPRLAHATAEVDELGRAYPEPRLLTGAAATVSATCDALDGATIAHVAAHGHANLDNPLFSALELADGPLMTYDLERLRRVPALFVLSACDSLHGSACGEELLGMATALLHLGSRAVVGSVAPLPDAAARVLMRRLHRRLAAGHHVADALRCARLEAADDDPLLSAGAHAVLCMGAA